MLTSTKYAEIPHSITHRSYDDELISPIIIDPTIHTVETMVRVRINESRRRFRRKRQVPFQRLEHLTGGLTGELRRCSSPRHIRNPRDRRSEPLDVVGDRKWRPDSAPKPSFWSIGGGVWWWMRCERRIWGGAWRFSKRGLGFWGFLRKDLDLSNWGERKWGNREGNYSSDSDRYGGKIEIKRKKINGNNCNNLIVFCSLLFWLRVSLARGRTLWKLRIFFFFFF